MIAGGKQTSGPHEAWIAADLSTGGVKVLITGPWAFERVVTFAVDDCAYRKYRTE